MPRAQWKKDNPEKWRKRQKDYHDRHGGGGGRARHYVRWTPEEDQRVLEHSIPDTQLALELDRSLSAIANRRRKIRKNQGPCPQCAGPGVTEDCEHR